MKDLVNRIYGNVYYIKFTARMGGFFLEANTAELMIDYLVHHYPYEPLSVNIIMPDGSRPKFALYTNPYYKTKIKELKNRG